MAYLVNVIFFYSCEKYENKFLFFLLIHGTKAIELITAKITQNGTFSYAVSSTITRGRKQKIIKLSASFYYIFIVVYVSKNPPLYLVNGILPLEKNILHSSAVEAVALWEVVLCENGD